MSSDAMETTATAHIAWDARWQRAEDRALWSEAEPEVRDALTAIGARGGRRALDLGCGIGRHALLLAAAGLDVDALDGSPSGLAVARAEAERRCLAIRFAQDAMTRLPYEDGRFDYALAWNVVYHGAPDVVATTLEEVRRVLASQGLFQGTMLSSHNAKYGLGRRIDTDTFIIDGEEDKAHPHFYCDEAGLRKIFAGFKVLRLHEREHRTPGSWHWHFLAEREA